MRLMWNIQGAVRRDAKVDQGAVGLQEANNVVPWRVVSRGVQDVVEFGSVKDGVL